jgi:hypothetical protein
VIRVAAQSKGGCIGGDAGNRAVAVLHDHGRKRRWRHGARDPMVMGSDVAWLRTDHCLEHIPTTLRPSLNIRKP